LITEFCFRHALKFAEREFEENLRYKRHEIVRVTTRHIAQAVDQMFANPKVSIVRSASLQEKLFLCSLIRELDVDNSTECTLDKVHCFFFAIKNRESEQNLSLVNLIHSSTY
jgi:Cdc6-like AAA superfamily ATPase